jgi:hypothetical protein
MRKSTDNEARAQSDAPDVFPSSYAAAVHDNKHIKLNLTNKSKSLIHDQNIIDRGLKSSRRSVDRQNEEKHESPKRYRK